ncbi:MAG: hypothetical protein VR65_05150 [Desulfobulbaceae bacterium BRH_c16a]|nr:MAG: hypothetical protein VR65_05150 [Desulfobulbaceae bacterium BRH_c16a]
MGGDSYTEVSSRSWFSRIGGAFKGIVIGLVLMAVAFGLLFWNEGRAVERYKTLKEGGGIVLSVAMDHVDSGNEGQLVHVVGRADTEATLLDPDLGVQARAIGLIRKVEMYQWQERSKSETRKKLGGGEETVTTYSYAREWAGRAIDSAHFKKPEGHANPARMAYESKTVIADDVRLGAYRLPDFLVRKIGNETPLTLDTNFKPPHNMPGTIHRENNGFYFGTNPDTPQVGDLRIEYKVVLPADISLVARQMGSSFAPYQASAGGTIELLEMGIKDAETMFQQAQQTSTIMTWIVRFVGFLLMALGMNLVLAPLAVFADVVPAVGSIVGAGTKFISTLLAGAVSFITIGIAWMVYRPLLGVALVGIAGAIAFLLFKKAQKIEPAMPPPVPPVGPPPVPGG